MKSFDELISRVRALPRRPRVALAGAADPHALEAVFHAFDDGLALPLLVDEPARLTSALAALGRDGVPQFACPDGVSPAQRAVELVAAGEADFLMKGRLETRELLGPVVDAKNGLRTGRCMSMLTLNELPGYPKLIGITDAGMVIYPDVEQKRQMIENAAGVFHALGVAEPRVAVLCGVEKLNPKMTETVDAAALRDMNADGRLAGCVVVGPVSYDVAMSADIAAYKGFDGPYCGNFDLLVAPTLAAGNLLNKCWTVTCGAQMAGIVAGARIPIVVTSRGSSAREKYFSIALAAAAAYGREAAT